MLIIFDSNIWLDLILSRKGPKHSIMINNKITNNDVLIPFTVYLEVCHNIKTQYNRHTKKRIFRKDWEKKIKIFNILVNKNTNVTMLFPNNELFINIQKIYENTNKPFQIFDLVIYSAGMKNLVDTIYSNDRHFPQIESVLKGIGLDNIPNISKF